MTGSERATAGFVRPSGGGHRYFHKLYALGTVLPDLKRSTKAQLEKTMQGHVLAQVELVSTYKKR